MKFLSAIMAGLERVLRINKKQKLKWKNSVSSLNLTLVSAEFQNFVPDPNRAPLPEYVNLPFN